MYSFFEAISLFLVWIVHIIYFSALLPQIFLNFKLKSTNSLSNSMIMLYSTGYLVEIYYAFLLDLPLPYKIFISLGFVATIVLSLQRLYYHMEESKVSVTRFFLFLFVSSIFFSMFAYFYSKPFGYVMGWTGAFIWIIYQIPQLLMGFQRKSVEGLSFAFISIVGLGAFFEVFASMVLGLPMPTKVNAFKGVCFYIIFCLQFKLYKK